MKLLLYWPIAILLVVIGWSVLLEPKRKDREKRKLREDWRRRTIRRDHYEVDRGISLTSYAARHRRDMEVQAK